MVSLGSLMHFMNTPTNADCNTPSPKKRFATVFPADFDVLAAFAPPPSPTIESATETETDIDECSSWEFHAPAPIAAPRTSVPATSTVSAAQEIANTYRKLSGLTIQVPPRLINSQSSSSTDGTLVDSDSDSDSTFSLRVVPGPVVRHDPACERLFAFTHAEATAEMDRCGRAPTNLLVCPRTGCRDTVKDRQALKMHLAVHDIADEVDELDYDCPKCDERFEARIDLVMHRCPAAEPIPPTPTSPTVAAFKRIFASIIPSAHAHA